jgi:polyisoprenyl-phosphate glycosyltransferase
VPAVLGIAAVVAVLIGLNVLALWVVGEYVGRSYVESLRRPLYIVRETINIDAPVPASGDQPHLRERHDKTRAAGN